MSSTSECRPSIGLVVIDFDDTLYDWIGHFVPALEAMVEAAAPILGVDESTLRDELREVHRRYGNTEHPFALLETRSSQARFGHLPRNEQRDALCQAFDAFDRVRAERLVLFPDVLPALDRLRRTGVQLVGYTAATSANIVKRIKLLKMNGAVERVYASTFDGMPYPGNRTHNSPGTALVELPHPKPHPSGIARICADAAVVPSRTLFVGDSVSHDVIPAIQQGAHAALITRPSISVNNWLPSLLEVTHRDVSAPQTRLPHPELSMVPTISSLSELWEHYRFDPAPSRASR